MARLSNPIFVTLTFSVVASFSRNWAKNAITCEEKEGQREHACEGPAECSRGGMADTPSG
jgi:hypothetical protein